MIHNERRLNNAIASGPNEPDEEPSASAELKPEPMSTYKLLFGVYRSERLVFAIGNTVTITLRQAEFIGTLLGPAIEEALEPGDYFAYAFVE